MGRTAHLDGSHVCLAGQPIVLSRSVSICPAYAWIPGSLPASSCRRGGATVCCCCIGFFSLLFFSGNVYQFFMLFVIVLFGLVMFVGFGVRDHFKYPFAYNRAVCLTGILALGVVAIQLLPLADFVPEQRLTLEGSHTLRQIFLDYTSKDTYRPDAYNELPAREEFYAYIGLTPFIALGLLPFAVWKRDRKSLLFFGLLLILVVFWISLEHMPWHDLFLRTKLFIQFRHLLRMLIFRRALIIWRDSG
jgi:hypothetical protein